MICHRQLHLILLPLVVVALLWADGAVSAGAIQRKPKSSKSKSSQKETTGPADYRSKNFLVHTDLTAAEARELLGRLETMLTLISRYWAQPNRQTIECYVVKDLNKWPQGVIPRDALASLRGNAGVTACQTISRGKSFFAKAVVYAVADRGTPQHEAVHAYCHQTFGAVGPVWYSEGMAEMGQYWREKDFSVNCHEAVVRYLRNSEPKSLSEIVAPNQFTGDSAENYAWRWALCHLLANNKNYTTRFRPLGLGLLTQNQEFSFKKTYGSMAKEISFEYLFFLKHLERGFRVDLCSWDWKAKCRKIRGSRISTSRINAGRGWQPSRLLVQKGQEYEFSVTGRWKTGKQDDSVTADGDADGKGKLLGILFDDDYQLSELFELGSYGSFEAPGDGKLLLRCNDQWNEIADNSGKLSVKLKLKGKGKPLAKPKEKKPPRKAN